MIRHSAQMENSSITQYLNILETLKNVIENDMPKDNNLLFKWF